MNRATKITSYVLIGIGIVLLAVNIITKGSVNIALPLLFLVLGGAFFILVFSLQQKSPWAQFLYIPGTILIALGIILLLNELTGDKKSWIYAWLLLIAAIGIGILLANRPHFWHKVLNPIGWSLSILGITGFIVIGVLVGGAFILWLAPLVLVLAGFSLRWLHLDSIVPENWKRKLRFHTQGQSFKGTTVSQETLIEPLSNREMEVVNLIDEGKTNAQIALHLSIACSTVKTHINNIYNKMGVKTRIHAVRRAKELGMLKNK